MADGPLISVIVPTFKRPALLSKAIGSVCRQTYKRLEIVVVDDGSGDATEDVVRQTGDDRLRYLCHTQNKGLPAARNTGIRAANGEFIAFLDDDDEWRADKLEKQVEYTKRFDAVLCGALVNGRRLCVRRGPIVSLDDLRRGSLEPSALLVRARLLKELLFDECLRQGEDWDAFIRIAQRCTIGYVSEPLLLYNDGAHQRMTNEAVSWTGPELETRAAVLYKHRLFFGEWWFRYHLASTLIAHISRRRNRLTSVSYAIRRCGLLPVTGVLTDRVRRYVRALTVERV